MIESTDGKQVKHLIALMEKSKTRAKEKAFAAEGLRLINEVEKQQIIKLYLSESFYMVLKDAKALEEDVKLARINELIGECQYEVMTDKVFSHVSGTVNSQGIMGIFKMPEYLIEEYIGSDPDERKRILLLDRLQDPGNLGTILRTAEAAGFDLIILNNGCVDIYNPKTVRSTMGAIYRMPFIYVKDLGETIELLREKGYKIFGAYLESSTEYTHIDYPAKSGVVIGNEGNGISPAVIGLCDERIRIPMCKKTESLNAAVAASLIMYEILRKDREVSN